MEIQDGVFLALEARRRAEEDEYYSRLKDEYDARLVEEARIKYEEEKEGLRLMAEEEAQIAE